VGVRPTCRAKRTRPNFVAREAVHLALEFRPPKSTGKVALAREVRLRPSKLPSLCRILIGPPLDAHRRGFCCNVHAVVEPGVPRQSYPNR
jgi:hypothetical protein